MELSNNKINCRIVGYIVGLKSLVCGLTMGHDFVQAPSSLTFTILGVNIDSKMRVTN
jgi:hypothetical protein